MTGLYPDTGPHVRRFAENVRAANEIAGGPIGESDLTSIRRDIEAADDAFAQNENAAVRLALTKKEIVRDEVDACPRARDLCALRVSASVAKTSGMPARLGKDLTRAMKRRGAAGHGPP